MIRKLKEFIGDDYPDRSFIRQFQQVLEDNFPSVDYSLGYKEHYFWVDDADIDEVEEFCDNFFEGAKKPYFVQVTVPSKGVRTPVQIHLLYTGKVNESRKRHIRPKRLKEFIEQETTYDNGYLQRFANVLKDRFSVADEEWGAYECSFDVVAYSDDNLEQFVYRYFDGREDRYTVDVDGPYECHYTITVRDER